MTEDDANDLRRRLDRYRLIQRAFHDPGVRHTMDALIAETEEILQEHAREKFAAN